MSKTSDEIAMVKRGAHLVPCDQYSADELALAAKEGQSVLVKVRTPRNVNQHRLAWGLAKLVAEATDLHDAADAMDLLKIKARHVRFFTDPSSGKTIIVPKSISFASCSQQDFSRLLNRFIWIVCNEIIPGTDEGDLRQRLEDIVFGKPEHRRAA